MPCLCVSRVEVIYYPIGNNCADVATWLKGKPHLCGVLARELKIRVCFLCLIVCAN